MAVVLYAMLESGVSLSGKHYEMMSAVDGSRGKDAFNHQFRKVKARAKELQDQAKKGGGVGTPVKGKPRGGDGSAVKSGTGGGKRKGKADTPQKENEDDDEDEVEGTPSKKTKVKAEVEEAMAAFDGESDDFQ
ncbi:hypothetical protein LTR78_009513 [Recurvomyces mirabilis]|uniref:Uncharacterized protein n=1 Tax=Recurvomyces mirabilis TaxID=574656 RepID=A0AAE0TMX9_9PEZI|nr:hypothetical protein LTR78_009513 [Recurvomyces mirabilis]KAK5150032.1 hypothetical protein LTS14_010504 [Recurvomyces mirabilis]